jgi:predicted double-glycine peptidase
MDIKRIFSDQNLVIQETSYTCGPVALLNALHLRNDFSHTEKELAEICEAKPGIGTSNKNLVKAAKAIGLVVVEEKSNAGVEDIERNIDDGAYVVMCYANAYSGNGHYTLVTGYDDRAIYCRDSGFGLFRFSKEYLENFWHGQKDASKGSNRWYMAIK